MAIHITPYTAGDVEAVRQFNQRIATSAEYREFQLPAVPEPAARENAVLRSESFLAVEDGVVRGGYVLQYQRFWLAGHVRTVAHYTIPVSEGVINRAYATVGLKLLRSAVQRQPLLFALGMGGFDRPLPRLLKAAGWNLAAIPFYFKVGHAARFLRNIRALRQTPGRRMLLNTAAFSGLGTLAILGLQALRGSWRPAGSTAEPVADFPDWADELWRECHAKYALCAVRDRRFLAERYPAGPAPDRHIRLQIVQSGAALGWAVVLDTRMRDHRQFGDLRVGTIADCFAAPDAAATVIGGAAEFLKRRGVDLIVSNQAHDAWGRGLEQSGFLRGPSNYLFGASPRLAELLGPFEATCRYIHLNRGDGDGSIHL